MRKQLCKNRCSNEKKQLSLMQRYGEKQLIPRNLAGSCRSCCDSSCDLRQNWGRRVLSVVS